MTEFQESTLKFALAMMTPRQIDILRRVSKGESLSWERGAAYIGNQRTTPLPIDSLLRYCAIAIESEEMGIEHYKITEAGKEILRRLEESR